MNKQILLRDNLSDTGIVPSTGGFYVSPDLITHTQVADPQNYFKDTYGSDVSMPLQSGSMTNFIYARVKNIGTTPIQAFIHSYACLSALFLNPSIWRDTQLYSVSGRNYVSTDLIQPGEIGVATEPFLFNAQTAKSYCHTGYVMSTDADPDFPQEFKDYDGYVAWIRGCTHAAARNHSLVNSQKSSYEQIDEFSNPSSSESRVALFLVAMTAGFPVNTRIVLNCEPLGIVNKEHMVTSLSQAFEFTESGIVPPGFEGNVRTAVYLPSGAVWPQGGAIAVEAYVNMAKNSVAAPYAVNLATRSILARANVGKLIQVGTCSTKFI